MNILRILKGAARRFLPRRAYKKSYSQCGEDLIIAFVFQSLRIEHIRYLDIGAYAPSEISNTYLFYTRGDSGVCVEPNPDLCAAFKKKRPRDVCLNVGVGTSSQKDVDFYVMSPPTLSTFSKEEMTSVVEHSRYTLDRTIKVALSPIGEILAAHFKTAPNLVSLDVEGLDYQILKGFDFDAWRPEVFCVETINYIENGRGEKSADIIALMERNGYIAYADTHINTIFVDSNKWKR